MNETPATVRMIDGATAPGISNIFVNNACAVCTLQITGSFTAAMVLVEGIVNVASNQWVTLAAFNLSDLSLEKDGADKAGIYQVGIEGILRVRMNVTEVTGGDITIAAQFGNATINQFSKTEASNLIPITAYDLAVAGGYTGTLEQFEEDMGNSGTNATAAANSADEAANSAESVSASASQIATNTNDISDLKESLNDTDNVIKTYLVESNVLHKKSSFAVGGAGLRYQQKEFYALEKTFTTGERYTFSCDSIVGNTAPAMRYKVMNGNTQIRTQSSNTEKVYVEITDSDVTAGANNIIFFVYASTSTPQTQACVLTNPAVYEGYATEEVVSYSENFDNEVERLINQSQPELETIQTLSLGTLEDGFINSKNGNEVSATSYKRTGFIHVQADKLKVAITFSVASVGFAFYDSRKKYISGFDYTGYSIGDLKEVDVPENAYYFRYCAVNTNVSKMLVLVPNYANAISRINTNPCFYDLSSECRTFKKILCIGDSLTAGQFDYKENGTIKEFNDPDYSYPAFLKALTGRDITNAGDAGETTVSWYELHGQEDFSGHDACIIMLGRNDYVSGRETTSEERATAFANIVSKVRTDNPQIPIFMATLINYYTGSGADTMNTDIRTAATANNCYLLDISAYGRMVLADDAYSHCTAEGYCTLAEYFFRYISYIMHNNYTQFKTIQFVGTDRSYT
jgi:lysophospholipase L1-like esterase